MPGALLYSWGPLPFEVYPFNVGEVDHATQTDWAPKEIAGAAKYRGWVGEGDETLNLRGKVFPHFFSRWSRSGRWSASGRPVQATGLSSGGLGHLDVMDNMRRLGQAHTLVRGDGWYLGWYVIERLSRGHSYLSQEGIGKQIQFEATFQRVPVPEDPARYFPQLWSGLQVGGQ